MSIITTNREDAPLRRLLTLSEAANAARVSPRTLKRHIDAGRLRAFDFSVGGSRAVLRIDPADFDAWVHGREVAA